MQQNTKTERIYVRPYSWSSSDEIVDTGEEDSEPERTHVIRSWCLNSKNEATLVRFPGAPIFCHIELPLFIGQRYITDWQQKYHLFVKWLISALKNDAPIKTVFVTKKKLYYYRKGKKYPMILACFQNLSAMRHCRGLLDKPQYVFDLGGVIACRVHEFDISPIRKLLSLIGVKFAQWYSVEAIPIPESQKISKLKKEYIVLDWTTCNAVSDAESANWHVSPKVLSFDIESYSPNHKTMPRPQLAGNDAYIITCLSQEVGKRDTRKRYALLYGDCDEEQIQNVTVIKVKTEIELIEGMCDLINKEDPEIIIGYNIFGFDNPYLDARITRLLKTWPNVSRLKNAAPKMFNREWESSGYGHNILCYLEMEGRISIDMYIMIKREFKLSKYDLNTVSNKFLNRGKRDVKVKFMFETYAEWLEVKKEIRKRSNGQALILEGYLDYKKLAKNINRLDTRKAFRYFEYLIDMLEEKYGSGSVDFLDRYIKVIEKLTKIVDYGTEDSELVIDLFEKLGIWYSLIEMSSINGVNLMQLFTNGQQVRCVSLIYDECVKDSIVIDQRSMDKIKYVGGYVREPITGLHDNIICLDFASLYPSIMQAFNIDYTTFVPPEDTSVPDSDCHIIEWEEDGDEIDVEVEEDTDILDAAGVKAKKKVIKKEKKIVKHRYRFYKHFQGIIPRIVAGLVAKRREVRDVQLPATKDPVMKVVLNARQLALKTTSNSFYGFLGVQEGGKLSLIEGAMSVTAKGRELIQFVNDYLVRTYNGRIVYNDTDSVMVDLGIKDPKECNTRGHSLAKEVSDLFPPPLKMEFEKAMRILCIKKKMYAYVLVNKNGEYILNDPSKDIVKKGITSARRDSCQFVYKIHDKILMNILKKQEWKASMYDLIEAVEKLWTNRIDWSEMILIRGMGSNYKSQNYFMKVFGDELAKAGKPAVSGERLEFVICDIPNENLLGKRMKLPEDFLEQGLQIDKLYYIDHLLKNSIERLFRSAYPQLLEKMKEIGYKPKGRFHFISLEKPVKLIHRMLIDQGNLNLLKEIIDSVGKPKTVKLRIINNKDNNNVSPKGPILRVHEKEIIE